MASLNVEEVRLSLRDHLRQLEDPDIAPEDIIPIELEEIIRLSAATAAARATP